MQDELQTVRSVVLSMHPSAVYQESVFVNGQNGLAYKFRTSEARVLYAWVSISGDGNELVTVANALPPS